MTKIVGNVLIIEPEDNKKCEICGKEDECRPYGPNFCQICYDCGMLDREGTQMRMNHKLFGDPYVEKRMN